MSHRT